MMTVLFREMVIHFTSQDLFYAPSVLNKMVSVTRFPGRVRALLNFSLRLERLHPPKSCTHNTFQPIIQYPIYQQFNYHDEINHSHRPFECPIFLFCRSTTRRQEGTPQKSHFGTSRQNPSSQQRIKF